MKVTINIDCSDVDEIFTHISVIRQQLKKEFKKLEKTQPDKQWKPFVVKDNNCYGYHSCRVVDDFGPYKPKKGSIAEHVLSPSLTEKKP